MPIFRRILKGLYFGRGYRSAHKPRFCRLSTFALFLRFQTFGLFQFTIVFTFPFPQKCLHCFLLGTLLSQQGFLLLFGPQLSRSLGLQIFALYFFNSTPCSDYRLPCFSPGRHFIRFPGRSTSSQSFIPGSGTSSSSGLLFLSNLFAAGGLFALRYFFSHRHWL